jgi:hypothetical protein
MKRILIIVFFIAAATVTAQIGHWEKLNPKNNPGFRNSHGLESIGQNKALLFGGFKDGKYSNDTWIFDLESNEWLEINCKNYPIARADFDMIQISKNKILLFGGEDKNTNRYNDLWCFDLDSMDWHEIIPEDTVPIDPTESLNMTLLNENEVLVYGGISYDNNYKYYSDKTYIYNIEKNEWDNKFYNADGIGRYNAFLTSLGNNLAIMYGGYGYTNLDNEYTWIFNGNSKKWIKALITKPEKINIAIGDIVQLMPGIAFLFGGTPSTDKSPYYPYDFTWIFYYDKLEWVKLDVGIHPSGRISNRMAKISSNKIILYGGITEIDLEALETWVFVIDTNITKIIDNEVRNSKIKIYEITDNEIYYEYYFNNPYRISLVNINGITLYSEEISAIENYPQTSSIPIDYLPSGIYFVVINTGPEVLCEKVVIY